MKTSIRIFVLALSFIAFYSCSKNEKVPIQLLLTDNPAAYDSVNIHIKGIQVKMNNEKNFNLKIFLKNLIKVIYKILNGGLNSIVFIRPG